MARTVLQIPLPKQLKLNAEKAALDFGFSSLQEILRAFMEKLAARSVDISFKKEGIVKLSKKNERRYLSAMEDFKAGKNIYTATSVEDLLQQLHSK